MVRVSQDSTGGRHITTESPAMRAAAVAIEASFGPMALCMQNGAPVVTNSGYEELSQVLGFGTLADLAVDAIVDPGSTITLSLPEIVHCHATQIEVGTTAPLFVVALHRDDTPDDPALSRGAVREVQQNLRNALQLLSAGAGAGGDDEQAVPANALTAKEEEVLGALMAGYRVPTIARDFHVSQSTVRSHLRSIFQKYGVHSQAALFEKLLATDRPVASPDRTD